MRVVLVPLCDEKRHTSDGDESQALLRTSLKANAERERANERAHGIATVIEKLAQRRRALRSTRLLSINGVECLV